MFDCETYIYQLNIKALNVLRSRLLQQPNVYADGEPVAEHCLEYQSLNHLHFSQEQILLHVTPNKRENLKTFPSIKS